MLLVLLLGLVLLLHRDDQFVVLVEMNLEILLGHARSSHFDLVFVVVLQDVDGRSRGVAALYEPIVAQKIVENARQPVLITSCRYHSFVLLELFWFNIRFLSPAPSGADSSLYGQILCHARKNDKMSRIVTDAEKMS